MGSGASEHVLDPLLTVDRQGHMMSDYTTLDLPHKIVTAGQLVLEGIATGTNDGTVNDGSGHKRLVSFPAVVVPAL